jgi:hypothetical protein
MKKKHYFNRQKYIKANVIAGIIIVSIAIVYLAAKELVIHL